MAIILLIACLAIDIWLLIIIHRQDVRKQLPWFASYVSWQILLISIQLPALIISPRLYVGAYWWTETIEVVLIVGAMRESFLRIFEGFCLEACVPLVSVGRDRGSGHLFWLEGR